MLDTKLRSVDFETWKLQNDRLQEFSNLSIIKGLIICALYLNVKILK